jgi:hypothetical protein
MQENVNWACLRASGTNSGLQAHSPDTLSDHTLCQTGFAFDWALDGVNVAQDFDGARLKSIRATCCGRVWSLVDVENREAKSGAAQGTHQASWTSPDDDDTARGEGTLDQHNDSSRRHRPREV